MPTTEQIERAIELLEELSLKVPERKKVYNNELKVLRQELDSEGEKYSYGDVDYWMEGKSTMWLASRLEELTTHSRL